MICLKMINYNLVVLKSNEVFVYAFYCIGFI